MSEKQKELIALKRQEKKREREISEQWALTEKANIEQKLKKEQRELLSARRKQKEETAKALLRQLNEKNEVKAKEREEQAGAVPYYAIGEGKQRKRKKRTKRKKTETAVAPTPIDS